VGCGYFWCDLFGSIRVTLTFTFGGRRSMEFLRRATLQDQPREGTDTNIRSPMRREDATCARLSGSSDAERSLSDAWRLEHGTEDRCRPRAEPAGKLEHGMRSRAVRDLLAENRRRWRELWAMLGEGSPEI
jgi:hypothetical protein